MIYALIGSVLGGGFIGLLAGIAFISALVYSTVYGRRRLERKPNEPDRDYHIRQLRRLRWSVVALTPVATTLAGGVIGGGVYAVVYTLAVIVAGGPP